jgi:hypothetical protein
MSKNLTLALPEDLMRKARIQAAEEGITLSEMVRRLLQEHLGGQARLGEAVEDLIRIAEKSGAEMGGRTWTRDDIYDRRVFRAR